MRYRCADCLDEELPEFEDFVRLVAAAASHGASNPSTWWLPLAAWSTVEGEAVAWLAVRDGRCARHASLLAAIAVDAMRRRCAAEAPVRAVP